MRRPLRSSLAMVELHSLNSSQERPAGTKKPGLGCRQKTGVTSSRLARPFSDLFYVAASRPAKSPRGVINAPVAISRQVRVGMLTPPLLLAKESQGNKGAH